MPEEIIPMSLESKKSNNSFKVLALIHSSIAILSLIFSWVIISIFPEVLWRELGYPLIYPLYVSMAISIVGLIFGILHVARFKNQFAPLVFSSLVALVATLSVMLI